MCVSVEKFPSPLGSFDGESRSLTSDTDLDAGLTEAQKLELVSSDTRTIANTN
jgi:hypothetical protein